jgi:uncharacterized protein
MTRAPWTPPWRPHPRPEWFRWLSQMRHTLGDNFVAGVVLYAGQQILPFGDRLLAAPISILWEL